MVPWRTFWKIIFQPNLKISDLDSNVSDSFLLSYMFVRYVTLKMCHLNSDVNDLFLLRNVFPFLR